MVLSDKTIKEYLEKGNILIDPLDEKDIQPASVDLHIDNGILVFKNSTEPFIDLRKELPNLTEKIEIQKEEPFMLHPGEFVLASTIERIKLGTNVVGRLEGKSSLGRVGLLIHSTAGYVDPGWDGQLTLELTNVAKLPITLYYGMRIGQISFLDLSSEAENPYGSSKLSSRYQGQSDPTASKIHIDFDSQIKHTE
ncbi:MAG: dCTP deaminase [Dehalococcoidia bacterium]|nr:dCTP deaminase [Dehalococcoidia bacterium]|tara:strand:+ start:198 stop:782 length:585 start_codon:yes stop_codon:yes gene_type:complete